MASIWKHPKSSYYSACFTGADGLRVKRSTKQTDHNKAMAIALEWERSARQARQGLLTGAQARKVIAEIMEKSTGEPLEFYTVEAWLKEWMAGKSQTKSEGTAIRYSHVVDEFIKHLGKRASLSLVQLSPKDIASFRNSELEAGKAPKTCNLAIKVIGGALNAARRQGFITSNPAEALESLPQQAAEKGTFDPEQVAALLEAAPSPDWRGAILMGYFTGARLGDIANMRWDSIDLTGKVIRFVPQKTHKHALTIPMHPQLESWLMGIAGQDEATEFVFPSLAGRITGGAHGLSMTFSSIMARAGIGAEVARPLNEKGRALSRLSFHSLRHGFNSGMANAGISQEIRMKLTGHASADMNEHYTHLELTPLRAAINAVPGIPKPKGKLPGTSIKESAQ